MMKVLLIAVFLASMSGIGFLSVFLLRWLPMITLGDPVGADTDVEEADPAEMQEYLDLVEHVRSQR